METMFQKNKKVIIRFEDIQKENGFQREEKNEMDIVGASKLKADDYDCNEEIWSFESDDEDLRVMAETH